MTNMTKTHKYNIYKNIYIAKNILENYNIYVFKPRDNNLSKNGRFTFHVKSLSIF